MARRPRQAATTSTLAKNPDLEEGAGGDAELDSGPAVEDEAAAESPPADADVQTSIPGSEPEPMASHPPPEEPAPRRRGPAPGTKRAPRAPATVTASTAERVALTDAELQDLGALTRLSLHHQIGLDVLVPELEAMLAAYRKARAQS